MDLEISDITLKAGFDYVITSEIDSSGVKEESESIIQSYGESLKRIEFMPNFRRGHATTPTRGFVASFDKDALVNTALLDKERLYYGTMAFPVPDLEFEDSETGLTKKLNMYWIAEHKFEIIKMLNKTIDTGYKIDSNGYITYAHEDGTRHKTEELHLPHFHHHHKEHLHDGEKEERLLTQYLPGSFITIANTTHIVKGETRSRLWIIVKDSLIHESTKFYLKIGEMKWNWSKLLQSKELKVLCDKQKRHLARLGFAAYLSMGVNYEDAKRSWESMYENRIECLTNTFTITKYYDKPVVTYYSECIPTAYTHGIIFNRSPFEGNTLLNGPPNRVENFERFYFHGHHWISKAIGSAFPVNTGKRSFTTEDLIEENNLVYSIIQVNNEYQYVKNDNETQFIFWQIPERTAETVDLEQFLEKQRPIAIYKQVYRELNDEFRDSERKLGYEEQWTETNFYSILTKLNSRRF